MKTYDLYGYEGDFNLEQISSTIEELLGVDLTKHESSFHCGEYYRLGQDGTENFVLQKNYDDFENEWTEEEYSEFPSILYVNETDRAEIIEQKLTSHERIKLLRRDIL